MAPEHEARPRADFYDHEREEPRRRRRPAADWGVGEDIFDRMPSRRFTRAERRAEHHEIVLRVGGDDAPVAQVRAVESRDDGRWVDADEPVARMPAAEPRGGAPWVEADERAREPVARVGAAEPRGTARRVEDDEPVARVPGRTVDSWMDDEGLPLVPGESRTIVLGSDAPQEPEAGEFETAPRERRTVKISGHPDRVPVVRPHRPRSAVDRIGTSPDRIVAYAVALGFLLVLIAVLTTGH